MCKLQIQKKLTHAPALAGLQASLFRNLLHGAQGGTRTRTLANYPLKVACLPIPPPGQEIFAKSTIDLTEHIIRVFLHL